jgi:hypothetical protein
MSNLSFLTTEQARSLLKFVDHDSEAGRRLSQLVKSKQGVSVHYPEVKQRRPAPKIVLQPDPKDTKVKYPRFRKKTEIKDSVDLPIYRRRPLHMIAPIVMDEPLKSQGKDFSSEKEKLQNSFPFEFASSLPPGAVPPKVELPDDDLIRANLTKQGRQRETETKEVIEDFKQLQVELSNTVDKCASIRLHNQIKDRLNEIRLLTIDCYFIRMRIYGRNCPCSNFLTNETWRPPPTDG